MGLIGWILMNEILYLPSTHLPRSLSFDVRMGAHFETRNNGRPRAIGAMPISTVSVHEFLTTAPRAGKCLFFPLLVLRVEESGW